MLFSGWLDMSRMRAKNLRSQKLKHYTNSFPKISPSVQIPSPKINLDRRCIHFSAAFPNRLHNYCINKKWMRLRVYTMCQISFKSRNPESSQYVFLSSDHKKMKATKLACLYVIAISFCWALNWWGEQYRNIFFQKG